MNLTARAHDNVIFIPEVGRNANDVIISHDYSVYNSSRDVWLLNKNLVTLVA